MAYSGVATLGFVGTNYNKVANGDWTRTPVLIGQCVNAVKEGVNLNKSLAKHAQTIVSTCDELSKTDKLFRGVTKGVNFISNNINPLIVLSSGAKVALAKDEDRTKTLITESGLVGGMFAGEGCMKKHLTGWLEKLPIGKKCFPIVKGLIFITGSLTASTLGQEVGKKVAQYWNTPLGKEERLAKEQSLAQQKSRASEQVQHVYKSLDVKA